MSEKGHPPYPGRLTLLLGLVVVWTLIILGRLVQLQVLDHHNFLQVALERQQVTRSQSAPRGIIYDSSMDELATSIPVSSVIAVPRKISNLPETAKKLATILDLDPGPLNRRMQDPSRRSYLVVKRRVGPKEEAGIEALGLDGIYFEEETTRAYPNLELACHVLGFVNMEGYGGAGIELKYDRLLRGKEGQVTYEIDARRRSFRGQVLQAPVQGQSLVLSLDKTIQYIVERELSEGVRGSRAKSGTAIAMEPDSGRILALANYPGFNCNLYNEVAPALWRNVAVSDLFEPGSTFKVVVAAAALEAGLTRPDELIDCQMGAMTIARHVFHDHKPYGLLTFAQVLENSSNIGAAKLGMRIGEPRLYESLLKFGFGAETGIDLPGEIAGLVRHWQDWSALSIGAISFGQEVGVTSMQMLRAVNVIANGGYLVTPTLVDRVIDEEGDLVRITAPSRTRIIAARTAAVIRDAFEGVVLRGTGRQAALEGYRAAGKTGTAQKIVEGKYSDTKYLASFVGFAPLPQPRISVLVQIDEPEEKIYGGDVAAPVFSRIVQDVLLHLHVPHDQTVPRPSPTPSLAQSPRDYLPHATPAAPIAIEAAAAADPGTPEEVVFAGGPDSVTLPDFQGRSKREVIERCLELGIRLRMEGSGVAVHQDPPPGAVVAAGESCRVTFARTTIGDTAGGDEKAIAAGAGSAVITPIRQRRFE